MSLYVMLPARNEASSIGNLISEIRETVPEAKILVANSDSTDETAIIALDSGVTVFRCPKGKGNAVRQVWEETKWHGDDTLVMLDADGTYPPWHILDLLLLLENYDIVSGSRLSKLSSREEGAMPFVNLIGNKLLTALANLLYPTKTSDLCTGYWAFSGKALERIQLTARGFELEANIFTELNRYRLSYSELPIVYRARRGSKPKLKLWDSFGIAWQLIGGKLK